MKIPSGSFSSFQSAPPAQARRARETDARDAFLDGNERSRTTRDEAAGSARVRESAAPSARVQRIELAEDISGPGRDAVSAYLAVERNSVPDTYEGELAGIDILI